MHFNPIPMPRCHILWGIHFCWMWILTPAQFLRCEPYCEFQFYSNVNKYTSISTPNVSNDFSNLHYSRSIIHARQMICDFLLSSLAVHHWHCNDLKYIRSSNFRHDICQIFTLSDFQAKDFTPQISLNFNGFSDKNTKNECFWRHETNTCDLSDNWSEG